MATAAAPTVATAPDVECVPGADDAAAVPRRNHRLSIMLHRSEALALRAIAEAWGVPFCTAGYAMISERLGAATREGSRLRHSDGVAIAAAILAGIVPRDLVAAALEAEASKAERPPQPSAP